MSKPDQIANRKVTEDEAMLLPEKLPTTVDEQNSEDSSYNIATFAELLPTTRTSAELIREHLETMTRLEAVKQLWINFYLTIFHLYQGPVEKRKEKRKPNEVKTSVLEQLLYEVDIQFRKDLDKILAEVKTENNRLNPNTERFLTIIVRLFRESAPGVNSIDSYIGLTKIESPSPVIGEIGKSPTSVPNFLTDGFIKHVYGYTQRIQEAYDRLPLNEKLQINEFEIQEQLLPENHVDRVRMHYIYALEKLEEKFGKLILPQFYSALHDWKSKQEIDYSRYIIGGRSLI